MKKVLDILSIAIATLLVCGGGGLIFFGIRLIHEPSSFIFLGIFLIILGYPKDQKQKGVNESTE